MKTIYLSNHDGEIKKESAILKNIRGKGLIMGYLFHLRLDQVSVRYFQDINMLIQQKTCKDQDMKIENAYNIQCILQ